MRVTAVVSLVSAFVASQVAGQEVPRATPVTGNPAGVAYKATLPARIFKPAALDGNVKGYIAAESAPGGRGVKYTVRFENLPKEGGPFMYHIHVNPVPADGNCTATLAHLDPTERGEATPCDSSDPASCQVGDLSGKHGAVTSDPFVAEYTDIYSSLIDGTGSFFGNRSFVFHYANKTRLTCANFEKVPASTGSNGTTLPTPGVTPPAVPPVSAAVGNGMTASMALMGLAAVAFAL